MSLTITRPALVEALERQGRSVDDATPQEMRTLVCAQCHVEYYFKGEGKYLTFPWDKGMTVEAMEQYYDEAEFSDWTHALSRTPMLKAQHPDYELFLLGPHSKRGLGCADCHMPYVAEGGIKYSNHQVMSPLKTFRRLARPVIATARRNSAATSTSIRTRPTRSASASSRSFPKPILWPKPRGTTVLRRLK